MLENGNKVDIRKEVSIIGGTELRKGIVLAKSDSAKKLGIKTADTIYSAKQKYRNLKVYPPNYALYKQYSDNFYKYLCNYSPVVERYSIDECFIDYTGCEKLFGNPIEVANKIKNEIKEKFGFTVNVGIGNNKLCAKMASDFSKPNKVHTLYEFEIKEKMWPLQINDLFMIGKKTSEKLNALGIKTIKDLAVFDINLLKKHFKNQAHLMIEYANGIDESVVESEKTDPKSISSGTVLPYNMSDIDEIKQVIRDLTFEIGNKLRNNKMYASIISVTIKYPDFKKESKQSTLKNSINNDISLYNESIKVFLKLWNKEPIRFICINLKELTFSNDVQLSLLENNDFEKDYKLQEAVDKIRKKYGKDKMKYADMIKTKEMN